MSVNTMTGELTEPLTEVEAHSVYTFWSALGECLYVGCTADLARRLGEHRRARPWWSEVARIEVQVHPDLATGIAAEAARIKALNPTHNRIYTDHPTPRGLPKRPEVNAGGERAQMEFLTVGEFAYIYGRASQAQAEKVRQRCLDAHGVDLIRARA